MRLLRAPNGPTRPLQLAVLGPTQTGKSTIVNLLLNAPAAEVSPLAGFTVHAAGFFTGAPNTAPQPNAADNDWTAPLFPHWERVAYRSLSREQLEAYSLEPTARDIAAAAHTSHELLPNCVVWDTPDFDSVRAAEYQQAVLEIAALADAIVLVVSKEKYADRSVWRLLSPLAALGKPLIVCLNKLPSDSDVVVSALRSRLQALDGPAAHATIVDIDYLSNAVAGSASELVRAGERLRDVCSTTLKSAADPIEQARGVANLIVQRWPDWTRALREEHAALAEWRTLVTNAGDTLLAEYRRDYLDEPTRFDAFRRAAVELLGLLEIPVVAPALRAARQIVTWPMRQLWSAGKTLWRGAAPSAAATRTPQQSVLLDAADVLLTRLERDAARRGDAASAAGRMWNSLRTLLAERRAAIMQRLSEAARALEQQAQRDIEATAADLYAALQQRPTLLNSLRAARVTADGAAVALAIKTGGAAMNDLLFAPALFAITSLLTEGALGSYTRTVEATLKEKQFAAVRAELIEAVWRPTLEALGTSYGASRDGASNEPATISPVALADAERTLRHWAAELGVSTSGIGGAHG